MGLYEIQIPVVDGYLAPVMNADRGSLHEETSANFSQRTNS